MPIAETEFLFALNSDPDSSGVVVVVFSQAVDCPILNMPARLYFGINTQSESGSRREELGEVDKC